jgi:solute carrier family 25 protein 16
MLRGEEETLNDRRRGKENSERFEGFLDSALSVARQRTLEVQKAHNRLIRRYTELQDKYLELKAANDENWMADEPLLSGGGERAPRLGEDVQGDRRRRTHGMWEPEAGSSSEPSNLAARTAALDSSVVRTPSHSPTQVRSHLVGGPGTLHPLSPGRGSTDSESSINTPGNSKSKIKSQGDARVFGRGLILISSNPEDLANTSRVGGAQNTSKKGKEKKDKGKEKEHSAPPDTRKEKKNLALRGIRGFDF